MHPDRRARAVSERAVAASRQFATQLVSAPMPGNPLTDPNWAPDLTDQITEFIGNVRKKTTDNAVKAARAVVFGLLGVILGLFALVLALIGITRGLQALYDLGTSWDGGGLPQLLHARWNLHAARVVPHDEAQQQHQHLTHAPHCSTAV